MTYISKLKIFAKTTLCALGIHRRLWHDTIAFQPYGKCLWCDQEIIVGYTDLKRGVTAYPLPLDCDYLINATVQNYGNVYTINEHDGELLVSPSPLRTYVRGVKVVYVRRSTAKE